MCGIAGVIDEKHGNIIDLKLATSAKPQVDYSNRTGLKRDWRKISCILWFELLMNDNLLLFRTIEQVVKAHGPTAKDSYTLEFLKVLNA